MKKYNQFILEYLYSSQQLIVGRVYLDGKNSRYKSNQEHYILYFGDIGSMEANGRHLLYMNLEKNDFQFRLWGKVVEDLEDTNLTIEEYLIKNFQLIPGFIFSLNNPIIKDDIITFNTDEKKYSNPISNMRERIKNNEKFREYFDALDLGLL